MARKEKEKQKALPRPKYNMAEPNDDMAAFGWDLGKLRYASSDSKKGDVWPGRSMFDIAEAQELVETYGFDIRFVCPKFVQVLLDQEKEIMDGAQKVREAGYTQAALEEFDATVRAVFKRVVVPQMLRRFNDVSRSVAEFYAARLAHIVKFGAEDDYIEANTTKSRR
jgi:hypothetical protein